MASVIYVDFPPAGWVCCQELGIANATVTNRIQALNITRLKDRMTRRTYISPEDAIEVRKSRFYPWGSYEDLLHEWQHMRLCYSSDQAALRRLSSAYQIKPETIRAHLLEMSA